MIKQGTTMEVPQWALGAIATCAAGVAVWCAVRAALDNGPAGRKRGGSLSEGEKEYVPPLPESVCNLLQQSTLCYLATSESGVPHLSLMNFTFEKVSRDAIIMTTRRNTKKFESILANPKVSILVSDFDHRSVSDAAGTCSITLNCEVSVPGGAEAERLRAIHAENNPKYQNFIIGPDIAVITATIERARICDVKDRVTHWTAE
jgi:general stress protein 26